MKSSNACVLKKWVGIAAFTVGLCVAGCNKPTPEQVAERTNLLFEAIESNDVAQAELYIKSGANVNAKKGEKGVTPLIYAVQEGRDEMVDLLIKSKTDINVKDTGKGQTPLIWAITNRPRRDNAIVSLIQAGADINAKSDSGYTALFYAEKLKNKALLAILKNAAEKTKPTSEQIAERTDWLFEAIKSNDAGNVRLCIAAGANVNGKKEEKKYYEEEEVISMVTPLISAIQVDSDTIVDLLIKAGADVNEKNKLNCPPTPLDPSLSPLGWTVRPDSTTKTLRIIELLIEAKANVNEEQFTGSEDISGYTPLVMAVTECNFDIAALLIKAGANVNQKYGIWGWEGTPLLCIFGGYSDEEILPIVELLIKSGANVNAKTNTGYTALMMASGGSYKDTVTLLIKSGADVNAKADDGNTALKIATENGRKAVIEQLKAAGAKE